MGHWELAEIFALNTQCSRAFTDGKKDGPVP